MDQRLPPESVASLCPGSGETNTSCQGTSYSQPLGAAENQTGLITTYLLGFWGVCYRKNRPRVFFVHLPVSLREVMPACSGGSGRACHTGRGRTDAGGYSVPRASPGQYEDV